MNLSPPLRVARFLVYFVFASAMQAFGQSASPQPVESTSQDQSLLQSFVQVQQAIAQALVDLADQGATPDQLLAWQQQNAAGFISEQVIAQEMATMTALLVLPINVGTSIPDNASATLQDFISTQAGLTNSLAQIHNQLAAAMPAAPTTVQIATMQQQEAQMFSSQNGSTEQVQLQRAQALAAETAQTPLVILGPTVTPPNATTALATYQTQHDQYMRDEAQAWNQYIGSDPSVQQAAMEQWHQQNASRIQLLQQEAQSLAQQTPTSQN